MEFDPSRVSLNQASDLAKSIQDASKSMGWPSADWKGKRGPSCRQSRNKDSREWKLPSHGLLVWCPSGQELEQKRELGD